MSGRAYLFLKDVVVLCATIAAAGLLWRRVVTRPERLTLSWEGTLVGSSGAAELSQPARAVGRGS